MLIAVDTNIPVDLASGVDDVADALAVIRRRVKASRVIASPTVNLELAYLSEVCRRTGIESRCAERWCPNLKLFHKIS